MIEKKQTAEEWLESKVQWTDVDAGEGGYYPKAYGNVTREDALKALSMAREEGRQEAAKEIFRELDIARRKGMGFYMRSSEYNLIKAKWVKED